MKTRKSSSVEPQWAEMLRENELHFNEVFLNLRAPLFLLEVTGDAHFRFLNVNPAFENAMRISRSDLIGKFVEEFIPEDTAPLVMAKYWHCVSSGTVIDEEGEPDSPTWEIFANSTLIPIFNSAGRVYRILGFTRNISAQKENETVLHEEFDHGQALFEKNTDGIVTLNKDHDVIKANQKFVKMLGFSQDELIRMHPWDWDDNATTREEFAQRYYKISDNDLPIESSLHGKDGSVRLVDVRVILSEYRGEPHSQLVYHDITLRRQQEEQLLKRAHRLVTINQVTGILNRLLELKEILLVIVDSLATSLNLSQVGLALFDESRKRLTLVADHPAPGSPSLVGTDLSLENNPSMEYILSKRSSLLVHDAQQNPLFRAVQATFVQRGVFSILLIPLIVHGEVIGTVGCDLIEPERHFTPDEVELAETITNLAAIRIEMSRLFMAERQRASDLALLQATAADISMIKDFSSLMQTIIERAVWLMNTSGGAFFLCNSQKQTLECKVSVNFPYVKVGLVLDYGQGASGKVAMSGKALVIPDYTQWTEKILSDDEIQSPFSLLIVPIRWQNQISGVIELHRTNLQQPFVQREVELLSLFSDQVAVSLENHHLYQELQQVAIRDALTGIYNRRGLLEMSQREIDRCRRYLRPISALLLDIDHFKSINDQYGHPVGDQVLVGLAKVCTQKMRGIDLFCRYGGEEFLVLSPENNLEASTMLAERLRVAISEASFQTGAESFRITVSIGVAELSDKMSGLEDLTHAADEALYLAKHSGRNQVRCYQQE